MHLHCDGLVLHKFAYFLHVLNLLLIICVRHLYHKHVLRVHIEFYVNSCLNLIECRIECKRRFAEQSADFSRYHIFVFRSLEHLSFVIRSYLTTNSLRRSVIRALKALSDKLHQACVLVVLFELRASLGKFEMGQNNFEIFWLWLYRNFLSSSPCKLFLRSGSRELILVGHNFSHSWGNVCFFSEESIDNLKLLVLLFQGRKLLLKIVNSCQEWGFYLIDILLGKLFRLLLTTSHIKYHK